MSLFALASAKRHTHIPKTTWSIPGQTSVLNLSLPASFLGSADTHPGQPGRKGAQEATDESQHLCLQGHQPQGADGGHIQGHLHSGKPRVPGALVPPQTWGCQSGCHPDPKMKDLSSTGVWEQRGLGLFPAQAGGR